MRDEKIKDSARTQVKTEAKELATVRELFTLIAFKLDKSGARQAEKATEKITKQMSKAGDAGTQAGKRASAGLSEISSAAVSSTDNIDRMVSAVIAAGEGIKAAMRAARDAVRDVGGAFAGVAREKIGQIAPDAKTPGEKLQAVGKSAISRGTELAATGTAIMAPVGFAVNTAANFEATMSKVQAITNATDADMARLTDTARQLGRDTQYSASEAGQAMTYLGMAGWKTDQIIEGMPGLLDLAAASGEDLALVADIVSDDLTAFHMSADQAGHMADVMAAASSNANTNVAMMGETFKYAGAVAGSLGYSLEDTALATGLMANAGIKGSMAGTSLRAIMTRLVKPTTESGSAMEELGISVSNSDGTMKPFRQTIMEMRAAFANLSESERSEKAAMLAGQEAMSGFLSLVTASDEDFAKLADSIDNSGGAAGKMAATMKNNLKGALTELNSASEDIQISLGELLVPLLRDVANMVKNAAKSFGEFIKEHPQFARGIMVAAAAIGSLLVALGSIGVAIGGIINLAGVLAPAIGGAFGVITALGAPVIGIIAGIAAAIMLVYTYWDEIKSFFSETLPKIWKDLKTVAEIIGNLLVMALKGMFEVAAHIFSGILDFIGDIIGGLSQMAEKAANFLMSRERLSELNDSILEDYSISGSGGNTHVEQTNNINVNSAEEAAQYVNTTWGLSEMATAFD